MRDQMPVLSPVDDWTDLRAVDCALLLAEAVGGGVRVLSVTRDSASAAAREHDLAAALKAPAVMGIDVRVVVHEDVAAAIIDSAASASTVCMTTAATLLPHEGHFGSIAEAVVRGLGRPVILLGPKAAGELTHVARVVVPLDGSEAGEYIVDDAARLARWMQAEVWIVTVASALQERQMREVAGHDFGALESGYVRRVAAAIQRDHPVDAQFEVLHGPDPGAAILDFAGDDAVVAMSTHGRTGLSRVFAGSVTRQVVAGAGRPVLVVRPPDGVLLAD